MVVCLLIPGDYIFAARNVIFTNTGNVDNRILIHRTTCYSELLPVGATSAIHADSSYC